MKMLLDGNDYLIDEWRDVKFDKYHINCYLLCNGIQFAMLKSMVRNEKAIKLYGFFDEPEFENVAIKSVTATTYEFDNYVVNIDLYRFNSELPNISN